MAEFKNMNVVVTGGASGIGKSVVKKFAQEGAKVIFADNDDVMGKNTCKNISCTTKNEEVEFYRADLSQKGDTDLFINHVLNKFGYVNVLVNNVGMNIGEGDILIKDPEVFENTFHLNVLSYIHCIKGFLPTMVKSNGGSIINISSTMSHGVKGFSDYSMSKGSIESLTKSMALDHAEDNVRINAVSPGFIATPASQEYIDSRKDPAKDKGVPMRKIGDVKDVANAILFLASDKASYITGHVLVVDGGLSVGE